MNIYDVLLLAVIALAVLLALRRIRALRRRGGCSCCAEGSPGGCAGDCAACRSGCAKRK